MVSESIVGESSAAELNGAELNRAELNAGSQTANVEEGERRGFEVRVTGFEGPFDLLLSLIAKRKLEVTAMALHHVTDDFVCHVRAQGDEWDLDETTEFVVVAAILLDLKAARLLPGESEEDAEDIALLEARDLLFARLLQYRAFKDVSELFETRLNAIPPRTPRTVGLDPGLAKLLPDVVMDISADIFSQIAVEALTPKVAPTIGVEHIHAPAVSVSDQVHAMSGQLRVLGSASFKTLIADCPDIPHVVARFLGLLELYRQRAVVFEQDGPLAELTIRWTNSDLDEIEINREFDEELSDEQSKVSLETHE
jgi:segregation and condensation protein A